MQTHHVFARLIKALCTKLTKLYFILNRGSMKFLYIMDPMRAWCYGFQPELETFLEHFPSTSVDWIMGGLAPDTSQPMDDNLKQSISSYWHQIEKHTQVTFNHDYWQLNTPYRSTYQACRAVISSEKLVTKSAQKMAKAIQSAYYLEASNPSLDNTLIDCARSIGLDKTQFLEVLQSKHCEQQLQQHLNMTRHFQISGFPALLYVDGKNQVYPVALGFCKAEALTERYNQINEKLI